MNLNYVWKLGLKNWKANVKMQKIDNSTLKTFEIVIADFQIKDTVGRSRFL